MTDADTIGAASNVAGCQSRMYIHRHGFCIYRAAVILGSSTECGSVGEVFSGIVDVIRTEGVEIRPFFALLFLPFIFGCAVAAFSCRSFQCCGGVVAEG